MAIAIAFPWLVCLARHPWACRMVLILRACPRAPLLRMLSMHEFWEHYTSQLGKEIDIDVCFDLCHTYLLTAGHCLYKCTIPTTWQVSANYISQGTRRKLRPFDCFCLNSTSFLLCTGNWWFSSKARPDKWDYIFSIYLLHDIVKDLIDRTFPVRPALHKFLISSNAVILSLPPPPFFFFFFLFYLDASCFVLQCVHCVQNTQLS